MTVHGSAWNIVSLKGETVVSGLGANRGEELELVERVLARARARGVNDAYALDTAGLLFTERVRLEQNSKIIKDLADLIEESPLETFLKKGQMTVGDFKRNLVAWMREQAGAQL